jgi:phosphatidylinositol glycan class K
MVDTCQATTLYNRFYSPNILAIGSSKLKENSYSHHSDRQVGLAVIDRFTYYTLEFFERLSSETNLTVGDLFASYSFQKLGSHVEWRTDLYPKQINRVPLTDFFSSKYTSKLTSNSFPLKRFVS